MNTTYHSSTAAIHGLRVSSGMARLQRLAWSAFRALATNRERGLQPFQLADLRFSLFAQDDHAGPSQPEMPTHDNHLPPPC